MTGVPRLDVRARVARAIDRAVAGCQSVLAAAGETPAAFHVARRGLRHTAADRQLLLQHAVALQTGQLDPEHRADMILADLAAGTG